MSIKVNNTNYRTLNPTTKIVSGAGVSYTKKQFLYQTEAIFMRAASEGFDIPNDTIKQAIDAYIRGMIKNGLWDKLDVYFEFALNNTLYSSFSRINWKRPFGQLATIHGGMTYTADGWKSNGVDGYINTQYNLTTTANVFSLNNHNVIHGLLDDFPVNSNGVTGMEVTSPANRLAFFPRNASSTSNFHFSHDASVLAAANTAPSAKRLVCYGRTSSTSRYAGANGTYVVQTSNALTPAITGTYFIGAMCRNGSIPVAYCNGTFTNWAIGSSLTLQETDAFRAHYNTFLNGVGITPFV